MFLILLTNLAIVKLGHSGHFIDRVLPAFHYRVKLLAFICKLEAHHARTFDVTAGLAVHRFTLHLDNHLHT